MHEEPIATLYRKPCPSCSRQYARDSQACPFCGYVEASGSDAEEDQERLYGEYLVARCKQAREEADGLRKKLARHPEDRSPERALAFLQAEVASLENELKTFQTAHRRAEEKPPERAKDGKTCPACLATLPQEIGRCACGHIFGTEVVSELICPHCTAPVSAGSERCGCGYPLGPLISPQSRIPGLHKPEKA